MLHRIRAAIACLRGDAVVFNTHTTGMHFRKGEADRLHFCNNIVTTGSPGQA